MPLRMNYIAGPGGHIGGTIKVPGDKSISHRAIMLGALAEGTTRISNFLEGADCLATLKAFAEMGVDIQRPESATVVVHGVGMHGLQAPGAMLDVGNSGTSMRLMAGLLCAQAFDSVLTGDESLRRRPMARVIDPLASMGASITSEKSTAPLKIRGCQALHGIRYEMPVASAQVKSCLLLAGMYASGVTEVIEPAPGRDHSERMLQAFGYDLQMKAGSVALCGGGALTATDVEVPNDISSAAFFMVAAAIVPGSEVLLSSVGINPTRGGVIRVLKTMGTDIEILNERVLGGEPVADIQVRGSKLSGINIDPELVPLAIDEFPALFIAAACAEGETILSGAEELRVKESDRIQVMADGLQALGIEAGVRPDGIRIVGKGSEGQLSGGVIDSHGDHRIAMSFAIAALRASDSVTIRDCTNVDTSFPGFVDLARSAGLRIEQVDVV